VTIAEWIATERIRISAAYAPGRSSSARLRGYLEALDNVERALLDSPIDDELADLILQLTDQNARLLAELTEMVRDHGYPRKKGKGSNHE
jgi:hypothetical protein